MSVSTSLIITLALFSLGLNAQSCEPVDYRNRLPPVRSQHGFSWCFAFAAADLLSFETRVPISAVGVGISSQRNYAAAYNAVSGKLDIIDYFERPRRDQVYDTERGENMLIALQANLDGQPLCREADLPQRFVPAVAPNMDTPIHMQSTAYRINELRSLIRDSSPRERDILPPEVQLCNRADSAARILFPSANLEDFRKIVIEIERGSDPMGEFYDLACKSPVQINPDLEISAVSRDAGAPKLSEALDQQLSRSPAAIVYNSDLLTNPDSTEIKEPNHASVIVARRQNPSTGACEYLLRNSWGPNCSYYNPDLRCENGHIWLPRSVIQKASAIVGLRSNE